MCFYFHPVNISIHILMVYGALILQAFTTCALDCTFELHISRQPLYIQATKSTISSSLLLNGITMGSGDQINFESCRMGLDEEG